MSLAQPCQRLRDHFHDECGPSSFDKRYGSLSRAVGVTNYNHPDYRICNTNSYARSNDSSHELPLNFRLDRPIHKCAWNDAIPSSKRRKTRDFSLSSTEQSSLLQDRFVNYNIYRTNQFQTSSKCDYSSINAPSILVNSSASITATRHDDSNTSASATLKRDRSQLGYEETVFMSRDEIDRCSPSRKDGIDALHEEHLRYSYCDFLQNLGVRLDLPQSTIGTAMVLCHRFFVRRSHASHDRFLIATSALFLASKSEETPRPLNDVLKTSCELIHKQDFSRLAYMLHMDWFEQYRERITEAEQLILTTLNFELTVQHPFESLSKTLQKLGFSRSMLVNLALNLASKGAIEDLHAHYMILVAGGS